MRHSTLNPDLVHAAKFLYPGKVVPEHFNQLRQGNGHSAGQQYKCAEDGR